MFPVLANMVKRAGMALLDECKSFVTDLLPDNYKCSKNDYV